jgi:HIRAN domain
MTKNKTYTYRYEVRGHFARQDACSEAHVGDPVWVVPEPDNEHDSLAVRFINGSGDLLGYVPAEENEELLSQMTGKGYHAYCAKVVDLVYTGEGDIQPIVEVVIAKQESDLPFQQEARYQLHTTMHSSGRETYEIRDLREKSPSAGIPIPPIVIYAVIAIVLLVILFAVGYVAKIIFLR